MKLIIILSRIVVWEEQTQAKSWAG